jgi:hypothetical protein
LHKARVGGENHVAIAPSAIRFFPAGYGRFAAQIDCDGGCGEMPVSCSAAPPLRIFLVLIAVSARA